MKNYQIRNYQPSDYAAVYAIWQACQLTLGLSDTFKEVERVRLLHPALFLVMENEMSIIGTVMGSFDGRRGYVHHLAVAPEHQKNGCGTLLMHELEKRYEKMGAVKIHLFVEKRNQLVVRYYEKRQWQVRDDLIMMSKNIEKG
jgi:ribosomal protein S18 acetylase RimI-like enzyme